MREIISDIFSYQFLSYGLIVGLCVSLCASILGVILVLKRYSMIGDGLSHVGFGALAIASVFELPPLIITIPVVIVAAFLLIGITDNKKNKGDSAIALISTGSLALGVIVISVFSDGNSELSNYLFGSILAISDVELWLSVILSVFVLAIFIFYFNRIFAVTFDETFSRAVGMKTSSYNAVFAVLTALTVVLGMKMMGSLLISALIIFPALISMRIFKTFFNVTVSSVIFSLISFFIGFFISYIFELPTGATIVALNLFIYILISIIRK